LGRDEGLEVFSIRDSVNEKIYSYEDLRVWQKAMQLVTDIYRITGSFPKNEQYRLVDQLYRAVISIPSNIAEGASRRSTKEYMRFINIAYSSLMECETQVRIAFNLSYIDDLMLRRLLNQTQEIGKMLNSLHAALKDKLESNGFSESDSTEYRIPTTEYYH
jgi:four helix bundle protein